MPITWNTSLIALPVLTAIFGSYTALSHAQRMRENSGRLAAIWMLAGGSTLGLAIWSMFFTGMLVLHLPMPIGIDPFWTALSLLPAIIAAVLGFRVLRDSQISLHRILISGSLMGVGISVMHYMGMAALKMSPPLDYGPWTFALSVLIAVIASSSALLIMYREERIRLPSMPRYFLGALMMWGAISAMHYTAMLGLQIPGWGVHLPSDLHIAPKIMALMISIMSLICFGGGLLFSLFGQRMEHRNAQKMSSLEQEHRALMLRTQQASDAMVTALRESEDRLSMAMQNAPDAVFITEQDGRIDYVNDQVVLLLGYDRDELYGMNVFDLVPEVWRGSYSQGGKHIISANMRQVLEIRLVTKDGIKIPMELNSVLLPNGQIYGSCRDIRDRKLAQKALKDSQEKLGRLLNSMSEGMYGVDIQGNCTFVNSAFLSILGFANAEEVLGKCIHDLIHHTRVDGSPYPASECLMYQAFRDKVTAHTDGEVFWRKDGVAVPVEYWSHAIVVDEKVVGAVATFIDISERLEKDRHIHQLAFYDGLTQLPNRRLLMERTQQALAVSSRNSRYGALMLLDLDDFKKLNDSKGHEIGDQLLCEVARRLQRVIREGDTVARLGGDEFVVVLEGLGAIEEEAAAQAEMVAEKIRFELNKQYILGGARHQTTSSIGVALFLGHQESKDAMFKYADIAMYQAKHAGRNSIRFYDPAMQAAIESRAAMETDLQIALEENQFKLFYQLQVNASGKPLGAEVLLRWLHPTRGMIMPGQFIPLAEESGLIVPVGLWMLDSACEQISVWRDNPQLCNLTLAVNVSAKQFRQHDFVEQVLSAVRQHGIHPSLLKLELTESMVLENIDESIAKMQVLKDFGVNFAMDDFGTGYSSLSHLKHLPLTQIKIDQSFVRDLSTDRGDKVMVMTIVDMCMNFELDVIAEGVETDAQFKLLHRYGCRSFQGYLFSRPVPVEQFELKVRERVDMLQASLLANPKLLTV